MVCGIQLAHARIMNGCQSVIGCETAGCCNDAVKCTQIKRLAAFLFNFDAENTAAQLMFTDDFDDAGVVEDRNVFFLADFKKCLDVCAASRSDGITCTFVETGIDLIDMVFKLDAMVFEPLNACLLYTSPSPRDTR